MNLNFDMPSLTYLKFGNIYSASDKNFNFKIFPNLEKYNFKVVLWKGLNCLEKSDVLAEKEFLLDENGLDLAKDFISSYYN